MELEVNKENQDNLYFNDPVVQDIKKRIIDNILIYTSDFHYSVQDHIASHYSKQPKETDENKDATCTEKEMK